MIQFEFNWSDPFNLMLLALTIALLALQLWLVWSGTKGSGFTTRLVVRLGLNVLLWLAVLAMVVQPYILREAKSVTGLLIGNEVPYATANALKDSIQSGKSIVSADLEKASFDTLILAGQDFEPALFARTMQAKSMPNAIQWIPYFGKNQFQNLHWKGIVRRGEMQVVRGSVISSGRQLLKATYGNATLDSAVLKDRFNQFKLQFPVFTEGRTAVTLSLGDNSKDTIRFFARPSEKRTFQFILDNPDFESRALATWLGKSGNAVIYEAALSKDVRSQENINKAKVPDVIITDADNVGNRIIKKHLAAGKSVLFINLTDPATQVKSINAALGTKLGMQRITAEETIPIRPGLTALPYRFVQQNRYLIAPALPVAVEKMSGNVGVSLLNETFPLQLAGDSIAYQQVWDAVFALVMPATERNIELQAPLFEDINAEMIFNGFPKMPSFFQLGSDTLFMKRSLLNTKSATADFKPSESGWISLKDSSNVECYVENQSFAGNLSRTAKLTDFVKSYNNLQNSLKEKTITTNQKAKGVRHALSDWMWFVLVMGCFLAVWIERKL